jgi:hypothetical protein
MVAIYKSRTSEIVKEKKIFDVQGTCKERIREKACLYWFHFIGI